MRILLELRTGYLRSADQGKLFCDGESHARAAAASAAFEARIAASPDSGHALTFPDRKGRLMSADNSFQLSTSAAEKYESQKVPSVFAPLAEATLAAVLLPEGARVIEVASGTGIVSRLISERLPGEGRIVCTDLNPAMIEVARKMMPPSRHKVEWFACDVIDLPFADGEFDIAICQQGLQFFPDKPKALAEIRRVLVPGGRLILTCWRTISPLFQAVSDSLRQRVSEKAAKQALGPFSFRDGDLIASLLTEAGFKIADASSLLLRRRCSPARPAIREEILASPYEKELLDKGPETIDAVVADVDAALEVYREGEGFVVPQEAHLFQAENPATGS
jgi:ubiquinone/menaquinone biosynthesis C-methylase UbiE